MTSTAANDGAAAPLLKGLNREAHRVAAAAIRKKRNAHRSQSGGGWARAAGSARLSLTWPTLTWNGTWSTSTRR